MTINFSLATIKKYKFASLASPRLTEFKIWVDRTKKLSRSCVDSDAEPGVENTLPAKPINAKVRVTSFQRISKAHCPGIVLGSRWLLHWPLPSVRGVPWTHRRATGTPVNSEVDFSAEMSCPNQLAFCTRKPRDNGVPGPGELMLKMHEKNLWDIETVMIFEVKKR